MAEENKQEQKAEEQKQDEAKQARKRPSHKNQYEELKELMQRIQADFENHKKRTEKEKSDLIKYANQKIVLDLLPVLDSFEAALKGCDEGTKILYAQIMKILNSQGLKKIEANGQKFNPYEHEAMMTEEGEEDDVVMDELQSGYVMNDLVLRPAKVKISKKKKNDNKEDKAKSDN